MTAPAFEQSEREAPDTRERRKAVAAHLRRAALALNQGVNNGEWNNDAFVCQRASDALCSCTRRAVAHVLFDDASKNRIERGRCRHRLCPHCKKQLATKVGMALTEILTAELAAGSTLGMLTLPIKHSRRDSLKTCKKALTKANADLIKRKLWRSLVSEYHRVAEVERGRKNGWNAHYHYGLKLRYSKAMAHELLRAGWFDKPLSEVKRAAKAAMDAAKLWRRGALADFKREKAEWVKLRRVERESKASSARATIYAEYARRCELAWRLELYAWYFARAQRAAREAARKTRDAALAQFKGTKVPRVEKRRITAEYNAAIEAAHLPQGRFGFLSVSPSELEDWLREEWRTVTRSLDRESYVLRLEIWKPGTKPGTILWRKKRKGQPIGPAFDKPVIAAVQELVKYTTKGHSKALKTGQVGFFQFAPWEVADYLKGVKNWHLHQSSRGWIAAQHAYEQEIAGIDSQAERDDGARRVSFVELVKDLEDAVAGELDDQAREEVIKTGVAILELHKKEREEDGEFSREQYDAIASHVAFLLGDDRSRPVNFTLTLPEQRELNRLRGRVSGPGVDVDVLLLAVRDRRRELAEISREVQALADGEQYSPAGQRLLVRQLRAEGRLKLAQDAVREAEERKRREIQVDAWVSEQREQAEYFGEIEEPSCV
jgi:hypothetical protein